MLWTILVIVVILWLLGFSVTSVEPDSHPDSDCSNHLDIQPGLWPSGLGLKARSHEDRREKALTNGERVVPLRSRRDRFGSWRGHQGS